MSETNATPSVLPGTVRVKENFLPSVFVTPEFDQMFFPRLVQYFRSMIESADRDGDKAWASLMNTLERYGLFEVSAPQELVLDEIRLSVTGRGDLSYRSEKPIDFGFKRVNLQIERARLSEGNYLTETAGIAAYTFAWRLFQAGYDAKDLVVLAHLDAALLSDFMREHHRGQLSAGALSLFLMARVIDEQIDELPLFAGFDSLIKRQRRPSGASD